MVFSLPRLTDDDLPLDRRSCQLLGPTALVRQEFFVTGALQEIFTAHCQPDCSGFDGCACNTFSGV